MDICVIWNQSKLHMQKYTLLIVSLLLAGYAATAQQRIVTAGSSSSEIVCALGLCDKIVATDRTSLYPAKLQALPSIGYRTSISAEGIISQRPDLVIFEQEYGKDELIDQLKSTGIETLIVEQESNFESTQQRIRTISKALKKEKEGEALIQEISAELDELKQKVDATKERPKVLCVYARGHGNMQVAGRNTPFTLLEVAGTRNAVPDVDGYKPLNAESLIQANPDYILFFESGLQSIGGIEKALEITGVKQTTAGKKRQVIAMDGVMLTNWGPRVAQAAEQLFLLTHPEGNN